MLPSFPETTLHLRPWADLVIDELGHDPRSDYVERYWLGILGPSATWLLRRFAAALDDAPEGVDVHLPTLAAELGLGLRSGRNAPFMRTLDRLVRFGMVRPDGDGVALVRRRLPPLTRPQLERLPDTLRAEHERLLASALRTPVEHLERARGLALSHLRAGASPTTTEQALHEAAVHPAMAHEAVAWAARQRSVEVPVRPEDGPPEAA